MAIVSDVQTQLIIQATCDHRAIFTSYDFGWPGSVQDSRVFKNSHLWRHKDEYFGEHEYILVDKGESHKGCCVVGFVIIFVRLPVD